MAYGCGATIDINIDGPGSIQSPNFPYNYDNNCSCVWTIITSAINAVIEFTIHDLKLEPQASCTQDFITFHDGNSGYLLYLDCAHGISSPIIIPPTTDNVIVYFETDSSTTDTGFNITYRQIVSVATISVPIVHIASAPTPGLVIVPTVTGTAQPVTQTVTPSYTINPPVIECQPLPTWLNLEFDDDPTLNYSLGDTVGYKCMDGYQFMVSDQNKKHSECGVNDGIWDPAFLMCESVAISNAMAHIQEPEEAENAPAIGSCFIILGLGIEIGFIILLDFHNIAMNIKFCRRHVVKKRKNKKVKPDAKV